MKKLMMSIVVVLAGIQGHNTCAEKVKHERRKQKGKDSFRIPEEVFQGFTVAPSEEPVLPGEPSEPVKPKGEPTIENFTTADGTFHQNLYDQAMAEYNQSPAKLAYDQAMIDYNDAMEDYQSQVQVYQEAKKSYDDELAEWQQTNAQAHGNLNVYLKRLRKDHKGNTDVEYTTLIANVTDRPIKVQFGQGDKNKAQKIGLITGGSALTAASLSAAAVGTATANPALMFGGITGTVAGATMIGAGLDESEKPRKGKPVRSIITDNWETIQPNEAKIFRRSRAADSEQFICVPLSYSQKKCIEKRHTALWQMVGHKNALVVVTGATACSITNYYNMTAKDVLDVEKIEKIEKDIEKREAKIERKRAKRASKGKRQSQTSKKIRKQEKKIKKKRARLKRAGQYSPSR